MKSPVELLRALAIDVARLEPGARGLDRDIITIEKRVEHEGDSFLTVALPTLSDALLRGLADGRFACPKGFARIPRGTIPRLFSGMFCKVFDSVTGVLLEDADISIVKSIYQLTKCFKKMFQSDDHDEVLDRLARKQFVEDDESCSKGLQLDERELYILDRVSKVILPSLDSFDERELPCRHGPGAVFEGLKPNQKWQALRTHSGMLERLGFDIFYSSDTEVDIDLDAQTPQYGVSGSEARLITVSKTSTSRRTITIEPVVRQFVQQGYNTILRRAIEEDPVLSRCLDLKHQERNQRLALEGSLTGRYATIDLKSASDKISQEIVCQVFRHKPIFLDGILSCRSPHVLSFERKIELRKYAGMGNATTFPVQSVIFATLAICALIQDKYPGYREIVRAASQVRVFGDDIIVPSDSVHQVVSWITKAGLTVNHSKSFTTGNFRESCGVDAFKGVNVTPIMVRFCPGSASKKEPRVISHFVALSNQAWLAGYYKFGAAIKDMVESRLRRRLPLVPNDSGSLGWHTRRQYSEIHRWNSELHRPETKGLMVIPMKRKDNIDGYAALLKFYHRPRGESLGLLPDLPLGEEVDSLKESPVRFKTRIVSRWVPA